MKARKRILSQIEIACSKASRQANEIVLVAVSKKQSVEKIQKLYEEGQNVFAENYVQEILDKKEQLKNLNIIWHLIGPLQANKVNKIVGAIDLIHSIDDLKIAKKLSNAAIEKGIVQKILIQVNLANEESKSGLNKNEIYSFLESCETEKGVLVCGLMCMPPFCDDPEKSRVYFKELKEIQVELNKKFKQLVFTSMGTTQDFTVAIEEGATHVRVGEALFGKRIY